VALAIQVQRDRVDAQPVCQQVQCLTAVADAVGSAEPEGVVEVAVDAFGIVASPVEAFEIGVAVRDGAHVFGAVELACAVFVVAVQAHGHCPKAVGDAVVVVPAVAAGLRLCAMGADPIKRNECEFSGVGEFADADLTATGKQFHFSRPVHRADSFGFDERGFLNPLASFRSRGHPIDSHQSGFAHEVLVVFAAQRGVVDNCLRAGEVRTKTGEPVDRLYRLATGSWHERCVKNDPRVLGKVTCCDDHELASPRALARSLNV